MSNAARAGPPFLPAARERFAALVSSCFLNLSRSNIDDQLPELNWVARARQTLGCHALRWHGGRHRQTRRQWLPPDCNGGKLTHYRLERHKNENRRSQPIRRPKGLGFSISHRHLAAAIEDQDALWSPGRRPWISHWFRILGWFVENTGNQRQTPARRFRRAAKGQDFRRRRAGPCSGPFFLRQKHQ